MTRLDAGRDRLGALEVAYVDKNGTRTELWSKLATGEPSSDEAAPAVAKVVADELRRLRDKLSGR